MKDGMPLTSVARWLYLVSSTVTWKSTSVIISHNLCHLLPNLADPPALPPIGLEKATTAVLKPDYSNEKSEWYLGFHEPVSS